MIHKSVILSLSNYASGSMRVRLDKVENQIVPNLESIIFQIEKENKHKNPYFAKLATLVTSNQVPTKHAQFQNLSVNCHFVKLSTGSCIKTLESFVRSTQEILYYYEEANKYANVDLTDHMNKIEQILKDYTNDPAIKESIMFLNKKYESLFDLEYILKQASAKMYDSKKTTNDYNPNIDENPDLIDVKPALDKVKKYCPECNDSTKIKEVYDIRPVLAYCHKISAEMEVMYKKLREADMKFCLADEYLDIKIKNKLNGHSVLKFLTEKLSERPESEYAPYRVIDINNSRYKEIMMFKDNSLLLKNNKDEFIEVLDNRQVIGVIQTLLSEGVRHAFNKNPQIAKDVLKIIRDCEIYTFSNMDTVVDTYKNNFDILRSKGYDILKAYKASDKESYYSKLEELDDNMNKIIKDHKVHQFAHSISSNKYNHLYNDESYMIIREIYEIGLKEDIFQDYIGKKIAAYKTPEAFNQGLRKFNAMFNDFSPESILNKIKAAGAKLVLSNDDLIIVEIDKYEQSKTLGSAAWCIVREEGYFNSYTRNEKKQYIAFDFTKSSTNIESMIGITLDKKGEYHAAHYKDDGGIFMDDDNLVELISMINENKELLENENKQKIRQINGI